LDILPDVHIAGEARESGNSEIYNHIVAASTRYDIMNDYNRTMNMEKTKPADLNADTTAVRSLDMKQRVFHVDGWANDEEEYKIFFDHLFSKGLMTHSLFNITGDWNVDDHDSDPDSEPYCGRPLMRQPLCAPLP